MKAVRTIVLTSLGALASGLAGASPLYAQETTAQIPEKVQEIASKDPSGIVLTLTAVLTVFSALVLLVIFFKLLAKIMGKGEPKNNVPAQPTTSATTSNRVPSTDELLAIKMAIKQMLQEPPTSEVAVAIGLALHQEFTPQHDAQSYVQTIKHRPTQWNARQQGLRQNNKANLLW